MANKKNNHPGTGFHSLMLHDISVMEELRYAARGAVQLSWQSDTQLKHPGLPWVY